MRYREALGYIQDRVGPVAEAVPAEDVEELVDLVEAANNVVIFGRGRSGLVGRALAIRLTHLGISTYVVGETITPPVREGDLVVLISGSGETFSVVVTGQVAKELGCTITTVTATQDSTLARLADFVVELPVPGHDEERARLAPLGTLFESSANLFFDGLVAHLMASLDETEADMRARHATLE